jgi:cytochrome oxidase assembly protein ShyY1
MTWLRRWGGYVALTIVFAIVCGLLSWWQWSRRVEAVDEIAKIEANYDAAPVALDDLLPELDSADDDV